MFTTFSYAIRNQKTEEYSTVETYSPLEGDRMNDRQRDDLKMTFLISVIVIILYALFCCAFGR